jgi:hypothetical protein
MTRPRSGPTATPGLDPAQLRCSGPPPTSLTSTHPFNMVTPSTINVVTIVSATTSVASSITTLQAAAVASREHAVGVVTVAGAPASTTAGATAAVLPTPWPLQPPLVLPTGIAVGTITGHPPVGLLFLAIGVSAPPRVSPDPWMLLPPLVPPQALPRASLVPGPPQLSLTPPPGRPSSHPSAKHCTGRRHMLSSRHLSVAFQCSPPHCPLLTRPWAEPRADRCRTPSS